MLLILNMLEVNKGDRAVPELHPTRCSTLEEEEGFLQVIGTGIHLLYERMIPVLRVHPRVRTVYPTTDSCPHCVST